MNDNVNFSGTWILDEEACVGWREFVTFHNPSISEDQLQQPEISQSIILHEGVVLRVQVTQGEFEWEQRYSLDGAVHIHKEERKQICARFDPQGKVIVMSTSLDSDARTVTSVRSLEDDGLTMRLQSALRDKHGELLARATRVFRKYTINDAEQLTSITNDETQNDSQITLDLSVVDQKTLREEKSPGPSSLSPVENLKETSTETSETSTETSSLANPAITHSPPPSSSSSSSSSSSLRVVRSSPSLTSTNDPLNLDDFSSSLEPTPREHMSRVRARVRKRSNSTGGERRGVLERERGCFGWEGGSDCLIA